jgi:hypothetical protein
VAGAQYQPLLGPEYLTPETVDLLVSGGMSKSGAHLDSAIFQMGTALRSLQYGSARGTPLAWDQHLTGEATMSLRSVGVRGNFSLAYRPSFVAWRQNSDWNSTSQSLVLKTDFKVGSKWKATLDATGGVSGSPVILVRSLSSAEATGSPGSDANSLALPGLIRIYTGSARASLTRTLSPRLSVLVGASGDRYQVDSRWKVIEGLEQSLFISRTSSAHSDLRITYRVSPRTDAGWDTQASRYVSNLQRAVIVTGGPWVRRVLTPNWSVELLGGVMAVAERRRFLHPVGPLPQNLGGVARGGFTYTTDSHRLYVSGERSTGDPYGLGAQTNMNGSFSWTWRRQGENWGLLNVVRFSQLDVPELPSFHTWHVESGFTRLLNGETAMVLAYTYAYNSSRLTGIVYGLSQQGVRLSFAWLPERVAFR